MADIPRRGSHFEYDVVVERNVTIAARDGVKLATDLYFPARGRTQAAGRFPVILERTPYLKKSTRYYRKASMYARWGYVMAIQDVRGRGDSGGNWYPFAEEAEDGYDSVEWVAAQPWCSGP
ncbi:MAG: CocE/NonD family hydrolase, partial [Planctomycetes bacterium]|nr:CocE/NonD family hydrolase [Planctomycetota bacterium]